MQWHDWASTGLAALGFVALSLALNAALLPHLGDALPGNLGDPMLNAWILGWVSDVIVAHPWDLWDAPIFHPHPNTLAYSEHLLGIALWVAPVYWLTGNAILTYNTAFLAGYAFAGLAMFVLVRRLTGRVDPPRWPESFSPVSPYLASSQIARLQMLTCGWSVLALAELHRFLETRRANALAGFVVCWAMQTLCNTYLGVFLALPIAVIVLHAAVARRPRLGWTPLGQLAAAALVLAALLAPVLSVYNQVQADMGFSHGLEMVQQYSADVRSYLSVWADRRPRLLWAEVSADRGVFPGAAVLLLAGLGLLAAVRRRVDGVSRSAVGLYAVVALAAFVLSLGPVPAAWDRPLGIGSPYGALLDLVPGFDGFRAPARFALPVLVGLTVLAGVGVSAVRGVAGPWRYAAIASVAVLALLDARRPFPWVVPVPARGSVNDGRVCLAGRPARRPGLEAADHVALPGPVPPLPARR